MKNIEEIYEIIENSWDEWCDDDYKDLSENCRAKHIVKRLTEQGYQIIGVNDDKPSDVV